jgi:GntR family transcriptional repressor for pyruvate dehydrogenase complex
VTESAEDRLWSYLSDQGIGPGDRLPSERDLAELMGLSRPTVRIAIGVLVGRGSLVQRGRSGTFVASVDAEDLLEARLLIEPYAASRAARIARPGEAAALREILAAAESSLKDAATFAEHDMQLHEAVVNLAGNSVLVDLIASIRGRLTASRRHTSSNAELRLRTLDRLRTLVQAIEAGDEQGASEAMKHHLLDVNSTLPNSRDQT